MRKYNLHFSDIINLLLLALGCVMVAAPFFYPVNFKGLRSINLLKLSFRMTWYLGIGAIIFIFGVIFLMIIIGFLASKGRKKSKPKKKLKKILRYLLAPFSKRRIRNFLIESVRELSLLMGAILMALIINSIKYPYDDSILFSGSSFYFLVGSYLILKSLDNIGVIRKLED